MAISVDHESSALYCMIFSDACPLKLMILRCCGCKAKLLLFSSNVSSSGENICRCIIRIKDEDG